MIVYSVNLYFRKFTTSNLGEIVDLLEGKKINLVTVRRVLEELVTGDECTPTKIIDKHGWSQISDVEEIKKICQECFTRNPQLVVQYNKGKQKVFGAFLGDIARVTDKKINMEIVNRIMKEILDKNKSKK